MVLVERSVGCHCKIGTAGQIAATGLVARGNRNEMHVVDVLVYETVLRRVAVDPWQLQTLPDCCPSGSCGTHVTGQDRRVRALLSAQEPLVCKSALMPVQNKADIVSKIFCKLYSFWTI